MLSLGEAGSAGSQFTPPVQTEAAEGDHHSRDDADNSDTSD